MNLTELQNRQMMPKLAGPVRAAHTTSGRNQAMALGQMITVQSLSVEPLLTAEEVAERLKVSKDWVWDHSSRRLPYLPVIRMSDGALRYRASQIEEFVLERERVSRIHRRNR
jgi:predicted DNA-binding transcriptional regulator AlpA